MCYQIKLIMISPCYKLIHKTSPQTFKCEMWLNAHLSFILCISCAKKKSFILCIRIKYKTNKETLFINQ